MEGNAQSKSAMKQCEISVQPGKPVHFLDTTAAENPQALPSSLDSAIGKTLDAYTRAGRELLRSKYADQKGIAPPHFQGPSSITVIRCPDGVFVRYDRASEGQGKIGLFVASTSLSEIAPQWSEYLIFFPSDPTAYVPPPGGLELALTVTDAKTGATNVPIKVRPVVYGRWPVVGNLQIPDPPTRPPLIVSVYNETDFYMGGTFVPSGMTLKQAALEAVQFIARSRIKLPVGWEVIEIYPPLGEEHWKPENATTWAELEILRALVQQNIITSNLSRLDSGGAIRRYYEALFKEFEILLGGPEEPVHQFLKQHPELLCPTHDRKWSKLRFGNHVSDFVFREPYNDYLLVEIEAPVRELFRKDGQQREELTHAIGQVADWIQFIADNKREVEEELGLTGISVNPRSLVVIGRSVTLSDENRRKLATIQAQQNKLRILTYDDVLASCRANLERILGPLIPGRQNVEFYYYNEAPSPGE